MGITRTLTAEQYEILHHKGTEPAFPANIICLMNLASMYALLAAIPYLLPSKNLTAAAVGRVLMQLFREV